MDSFDKQWQRWFPEGRDKSNQPGRRTAQKSNRIILLLALGLALFILINIGKGLYSEWLWFNSLGYASVYTTVLSTKVLVFLLAAAIFAIVFLGNLVLATRLAPKKETHFWPWALVSQLRQILRINVILGTALLSLIFGLVAQSQWEVILRFFNAQPFGISDPVFHREVGFYVFSLPFLGFLRGWLTGAVIITAIGSAGVYLLAYTAQRLKFDFSRSVMAHIGGLAMALLALFAWGYWLNIWELVFSRQGVVFGAGYADIHARYPAQIILLVTVLAAAGLVLVSALRRNYRWSLLGIGGWLAAAILIGGIFPAAVQRFQVEPNELVREMPYIENNIAFTREAFALDRIEEHPFPAEDMPTITDITENEGTINNVRLWDPRPLKDTYQQLHSIRLYYDFNDVDIDRYIINGEYREVMLSARELSAEKLAGEAQTWVNRKLQFTHGYGFVMSPVNEVTNQGLPVLLEENIPPVGVFDIERPEIYYGEKTSDYVIVKTNTQEFDYPRGDDNVYINYLGDSGVSLGSFPRRLVYAWQFGDLNILISNELTPESRILYRRNIQQRVKYLAPFLELDSDPYLVVTEGRLFWIQDAYTTTDRYPYSEPYGNGLNYIRNSVKVVIDAYDGSVAFYIADPEDALIRTYQAIFPELFIPDGSMSESLLDHWRYPEDMFNIQAAVYESYHMRDGRVFYNKEDVWAVPQEFYADKKQSMEPYYIIMRLPDEEQEEFLLMLPFTPTNKNNAISWLAARCDGENYGKLLAYHFPKERVVKGPSQIEDRIQQDTAITEQFALWGRGGSRVIRGNLLLIPVGKSKLYVEPVFLQAEAGGLPELKRVIVVAGEEIAMRSSLEESLAAVFGIEAPTDEVTPPPEPDEPLQPISGDLPSLIREAQQHYDLAQQRLASGDWAGYGEELAALKVVLEHLAKLTE